MERIHNISELPPDIRIMAEINREEHAKKYPGRYKHLIERDGLNSAFSWDNTPQGHTFWQSIYEGIDFSRYAPNGRIDRYIKALQTDDQIIF